LFNKGDGISSLARNTAFCYRTITELLKPILSSMGHLSMRYAIVTNPASGKLSIDEKRSALRRAARILESDIYGLETQNAAELVDCARHLSTQCDVIVVAGGDGAFSDIVNSLDTAQITLAFLPLGSGNALKSALAYKGSLEAIAERIKTGGLRKFDLIDCDGRRRAFMASVGFEGKVIAQRDRYLLQGAKGFHAYSKSFFLSYLKYGPRPTARLRIDEDLVEIEKILSILIMKQPFYGYGMKVACEARFDDGKLHILGVNSGLLGTLLGAFTAFTFGNRIGKYWTGHELEVILNRPLPLQIDGNVAWEDRRFVFRILPESLSMKC
jgi:diacylglycerol kinase family enzyme